MKRVLFFCLSLLLLMSLIACGREAPGNLTGVPETGTAGETTEPAATETEEPIVTTAETGESAPLLNENDLETLFDRNLNCVLNIFDLGYLQFEEASENGLHKVTDPRFKDFAELEAYVRETYVPQVANELLFGEIVPGHTMYVNRDGALYIDETVLGGVGYYVDWSRYTVSVESLDGNTCVFTVTASILEPGDNVTPEPYVKTATAVYENGAWLLTEKIY